jgi:hypothetical protein
VTRHTPPRHHYSGICLATISWLCTRPPDAVPIRYRLRHLDLNRTRSLVAPGSAKPSATKIGTMYDVIP